jgi:hypothetical protein
VETAAAYIFAGKRTRGIFPHNAFHVTEPVLAVEVHHRVNVRFLEFPRNKVVIVPALAGRLKNGGN